MYARAGTRAATFPVCSSPRGWGMLTNGFVHVVNVRFIPTRVGNAGSLRWAGQCATVHPHTGGEYDLVVGGTPCQDGSSPHGWGIRWAGKTTDTEGRFIPTRVGNTMRSYSSIAKTPVHTHTVGEYGVASLRDELVGGSSPHGWGIRSSPGLIEHIRRFIPTRVGNTTAWSLLPRGISVHPHAGGECCWPVLFCQTHCGSSPRGWGILPLVGVQHHPDRFIPTRVGNACG